MLLAGSAVWAFIAAAGLIFDWDQEDINFAMGVSMAFLIASFVVSELLKG